MSDNAIVKWTLIEGWVVGPLFGINIVFFVICAKALLKRRANTSARWLLAISTLQLLISCSHAGVVLANIVHAFVFLEGDAQLKYAADEGTPLHTTEQALYTFNDLIAGGILTWRCLVVWNYNWRPCAFLVLSCVGTAVGGIGSVVKLTMIPTNQAPFFQSSLKAWLSTFWIMSVVTQVSATSLIAWKIWFTIAWRARPVGSREWHALLVFVESGALYSIGTVLVLALYLVDLNGGTIIAGMLGQLSATAPFLIIVTSEARRSASVVSSRRATVGEYTLNDISITSRRPKSSSRAPGALALYDLNAHGKASRDDSLGGDLHISEDVELHEEYNTALA